MAKTPEWQSLARKLRRGKTLEQAAEESGIELDKAKEWLEEQRKLACYDDDSLRLVAGEALRHGIDRLVKASREPERVGSTFTVDEEGGKSGINYALTDVDAAKALVKFALDARKMLVGKAVAKKIMDQPDLFDGVAASGSVGHWVFRDN